MSDAWSIRQAVYDFLRLRSRAYRMAFPDPKNNEALKDLAKFCRADSSCFHTDPRLHAVLEGRREVWLRIQHHLRLQPDELYELYNKPSTIKPPTKE